VVYPSLELVAPNDESHTKAWPLIEEPQGHGVPVQFHETRLDRGSVGGGGGGGGGGGLVPPVTVNENDE
jgi:hypothetical protein